MQSGKLRPVISVKVLPLMGLSNKLRSVSEVRKHCQGNMWVGVGRTQLQHPVHEVNQGLTVADRPVPSFPDGPVEDCHSPGHVHLLLGVIDSKAEKREVEVMRALVGHIDLAERRYTDLIQVRGKTMCLK